MKKLSLLTLVNQYIDDEKKRNKTMRSMSAIYQWIEGDVDDELTAINDEYNLIVEKNDKQARIIFEDSIKAQFKTNYFQDFLLNKSKPTRDYYKKFLEKCSISEDAIKGFFKPESGSNNKTLDFFTAFCKHQQREYGEKGLITISHSIDPVSSKDIETETLQISGATIINSEFIERIYKGKTFTMPEFYSAKQTDFCQWYGIIHKFDVVRNGYDTLKNVIIDSFIEEKHEKVTAIICGSGGSGKSTALRRTAVDLHKEPIHIVWVEDGGIEEFVEKGFPAIKSEVEKNKKQKFLIIIEDWYRTFTKENEQSGTDILKKAKSTNNIRFVIGDRTIKQSYRDHRNNDFELHLSSDDNKEIIEKIVEKYPNWKLASEKLLKENNNNYKSSLFLLLFILARIDQKEFNNTTLNLAEPQQVFQRIIESDLGFIAMQEKKAYIGLAKVLYYWACIYDEHKIYISYETFLKIADHYNEKNTTEIYDLFSRWNADDEILDRLKLYINKNEEGQLQFNHDILAESLSKANIEEEWKKFGTKIELDLLNFIIDNGDDDSASLFLWTMFSRKGKIFESKEHKLLYIDKLLKKKNQHPSYIYELSRLGLDGSELKNYARKLWEIENHNDAFWSYYLAVNKNDVFINGKIKNLLINSKLTDYDPTFISVLLVNLKDYELIKKISEEILNVVNWRGVPSELIYTCLDLSKNLKIKQIFSNVILQDKNWRYIDSSIISKCIELSDDKVRQDFSNTVLNDNNLEEIPFQIIYSCLTISKNKEIALFFLKNWRRYSEVIFYESLLLFENENKFPRELTCVIEDIIYNYHNQENTIEYDFLLRINLKNHTLWKKESDIIIRDWQKNRRNLVTNVLYSHRNTPFIIKSICKDILKLWKTEINKSIPLLYRETHHLDHVKISLGHPDLKDQAKLTAIEIIQACNIEIPKYIQKVAEQIVENDIYPEWEI